MPFSRECQNDGDTDRTLANDDDAWLIQVGCIEVIRDHQGRLVRRRCAHRFGAQNIKTVPKDWEHFESAQSSRP